MQCVRRVARYNSRYFHPVERIRFARDSRE